MNQQSIKPTTKQKYLPVNIQRSFTVTSDSRLIATSDQEKKKRSLSGY